MDITERFVSKSFQYFRDAVNYPGGKLESANPTWRKSLASVGVQPWPRQCSTLHHNIWTISEQYLNNLHICSSIYTVLSPQHFCNLAQLRIKNGTILWQMGCYQSGFILAFVKVASESHILCPICPQLLLCKGCSKWVVLWMRIKRSKK